MMEFLRQNTAATIIISLIDWADGKTLPPSITVADLKCTLYKNGIGESIELSESGDNAINISGLSDGMATLTLTSDDTDTQGRLKVILSNAIVDEYPTDVILRTIADFMVLNQSAYDALFGSGNLTVNISETDKSDISDYVTNAVGGLNDLSVSDVSAAIVAASLQTTELAQSDKEEILEAIGGLPAKAGKPSL